MISSTMVRGTILVKARKTQIENSDEYYMEFNLSEGQVSQLVAELLAEHTKNGSLVISRSHENEFAINTLKEVLEKYPDMPEQMKQDYYKTILSLSK